jgi:CBS domain-containing protein
MPRRICEAVHEAVVSRLDLGLYVTAEPDLPVADVMERMRRCRCGTAIVTENGAWSQPVREFMTAEPVSVKAQDRVLSALQSMHSGHFRNVPVLDARGHLVGNLTDHALVQHLCERLEREILTLPPNPDQVPDTVEGA